MAIVPVKLNIRIASPEDADAIGRAHSEGWDAAYRGLMADTAVDEFIHSGDHTERWSVRLEEEPEERDVWVAEVDGKVVGFAQTGPNRPSASAHPSEPKIAELYCIYLGAGAIGTGVGRRLFAHAIDHLRSRGYEQVVLWVLERNERARRFYKAAGWQHDGTSRIDPGDGCKDLRYSIDL
ncbi:MAG: GNAT family N-acetyltransferase [Chloroflexi bacterium]|nr:GNAT family N-acetyltransferase [Chloroflexota bacterium]MCH8102859.1 GNAT family N-acetyltransferase [Chloroflexota bacterium]